MSLFLDQDLVAEARTLAGPGRLSSYVNRALGRQLQHDSLAEFLDEIEEENGPIDTEILESVRQAWPGPGGSDGDGGTAGTS
ncbi:MAG TPA: CopG family transcriptional regulator [Thermoanaerobaculia bacterium]|nr:CopG family transcriptional regulator [Thermoanaerobaculia bacterium]